MKVRDFSLDILRTVFMLFIVLAHVNPPFIIFQFRTFDVVGLVLLSGMCMNIGSSNSCYFEEQKKRFKRLILPTYASISVILIGTYIVCYLFDAPYFYNINNILTSYMLVDGIGYVWIVRVLLIISMLKPIVGVFAKLNNKAFTICFFVAMLINTVLASVFPLKSNMFCLLFNYYVIYTISYFFIACIGIKIKDISNKEKIYLILSAFFILLFYKFCAFVFYNIDLLPFHKHPPMLDWVLYGLIVTNILLLVKGDLVAVLDKFKLRYYVSWFSENCFTFYFMHVFIIKGIHLLEYISSKNYLNNWMIRYIFVLFTSLFLTFIFERLRKEFYMKYN